MDTEVFKQLEPDMTGWSLQRQLEYDQMMYGFGATKRDATTGEEFRVHPLDIRVDDLKSAAEQLCDLCLREAPCECGEGQCFCSCGDCQR
jgi:hypothetical protein